VELALIVHTRRCGVSERVFGPIRSSTAPDIVSGKHKLHVPERFLHAALKTLKYV